MRETEVVIRQQRKNHIFFFNQELNPRLKEGIRPQASPSGPSIHSHSDCKIHLAADGQPQCILAKAFCSPAKDWHKFYCWYRPQHSKPWRSPKIICTHARAEPGKDQDWVQAGVRAGQEAVLSPAGTTSPCMWGKHGPHPALVPPRLRTPFKGEFTR